MESVHDRTRNRWITSREASLWILVYMHKLGNYAYDHTDSYSSTKKLILQNICTYTCKYLQIRREIIIAIILYLALVRDIVFPHVGYPPRLLVVVLIVRNMKPSSHHRYNNSTSTMATSRSQRPCYLSSCIYITHAVIIQAIKYVYHIHPNFQGT